jgi:uncharacterized membrane protein YeaQ/YmgE (transglycosylase-associated protein family)
MGIIIFLIIGAIVGWLAAQLMGRSEGLLASIVIGIIGSFIGGFLSVLVTGSNQSYLGFSWVGVFWSLVGSIVLVALLNMFSSARSSHRTM